MNIIEPIHWAAFLMAFGFLLVLLEFFIPSGGILGVLSGAVILLSIAMAFYNAGPRTGALFLLAAAILVPLLLGLAIKVWPMTPMGKAFLGELPSDEEVVPIDERKELVGRTGLTQSKMVPSGSIEIDGRIIDAVSKGMYIDKGERVIVVEVQGNAVIVRPTSSDDIPAEERPEEILSKPLDDHGFDAIDDVLG